MRKSLFCSHEKTEHSKYSGPYRFLDDIDSDDRDGKTFGSPIRRQHSSRARSSLAVSCRLYGAVNSRRKGGGLVGRTQKRGVNGRVEKGGACTRVVPGVVHLREGAPVFRQICRLAQEIPADLIVMPTHGYTGFRHVFLGSTAERVVQHSPCPVFVVRPRKRKSETGRTFTPQTILVPVDFSNSSREGLRYAIRFANEFGGRIILLHATYLGYVYSSEATAIYDIPALQKAARKNAERQMRELVRTANFGAVKFETDLYERLASARYLRLCKGSRCRSDHYIDAWADGFRNTY